MTTINAQTKPGNVEKEILKTVVKIEIPLKKSGKQPNGTGFLVSKSFKSDSKQKQFLLVTNKHVVGDWNLADGNIANYYSDIDLFFYSKVAVNGQLYIKKRISLLDSTKKVTPKLKLHPNPKVDVVILDITEQINSIQNIDLFYFDKSFLLEFDEIFDNYNIGVGDQVFALGYPLGITSSISNLPIAKSGYIASLPGEEFEIELTIQNRAGKNILVKQNGKLLIIDGLIVGGNSGGPIVMPSSPRFRLDEKLGLQHHTSPQNLVLGIVSSGLNSSGLSIIYSSDYILELIESI